MRRATWLAGAVLGWPLAPAAQALPLGPDGAVDLTLLVVPRLDLAPLEQGGTDPYLDRASFGLEGRHSERLAFQLLLGVDDLGRGGDWSADLALREAWAEWAVDERLQLDAGLFTPPWSLPALLRDEGRIGVSDHGVLVASPAGRSGRDAGLQVRGRLFHRRLEYRLAGLAGVETGQGLDETDYDGDGAPDAPALSPDDLPRVAARLCWSFFDPLGDPGPAGMHPRQVALGGRDGSVAATRKVLTVGLGIDHQQDALYVEERDYGGEVVSARRADWTALTGDLLVDLPLAGDRRSLHALVAGFWYPLDERHPDAGQGLLAEAGYRLGRWEPTATYELRDAGPSDTRDWVSGRIGLCLWLPEHAVALRLEAGAWRAGGGQALSPAGQIQAELAF